MVFFHHASRNGGEKKHQPAYGRLPICPLSSSTRDVCAPAMTLSRRVVLPAGRGQTFFPIVHTLSSQAIVVLQSLYPRFGALFLVTIVLTCSVVTAGSNVDLSTEDAVDPSTNIEDLWLVSTRGLSTPRCRVGCTTLPCVRRRVQGRWKDATVDEFVAESPTERTTCFYIHGNRMSANDACQQGMQVYRKLAACDPTIRFVIWSWPSDKVVGLVRDARIKERRADAESLYLACFLTRIPPSSRVSLVGYSFGGRTVAGALQLLAGGRAPGGNRLPVAKVPTIRCVMLASAAPSTWFAPSAPYGLWPLVCDQMYSIYNTSDPVLKLYRLTSKQTTIEPMGYRGVPRSLLGDHAGRIVQCNVADSVGHSHAFDRYWRSTQVVKTVRWYALWFDMSESAAAKAEPAVASRKTVSLTSSQP